MRMYRCDRCGELVSASCKSFIRKPYRGVYRFGKNLALDGFAHAKRAMHRAKSGRQKRKRLRTGTEGLKRNDLHRRHSRFGENDTAA